MGGDGSTRWLLYSKKNTVENCLTLDIKGLINGHWNTGTLTWSRNGEILSSIGYESRCDMIPPYLRLKYTWGKTHDKVSIDNLVKVTPNYLILKGNL